MIFLVLLIGTFANSTSKERACFVVVREISHSKEYDSSEIIKSSGKSGLNLLNYILSEMFDMCMEKITEEQIEEYSSSKRVNKIPDFIGVKIADYKDKKVPNGVQNFFKRMMDFKQSNGDL